jgi:zinc transport system ATP-binding protein
MLQQQVPAETLVETKGVGVQRAGRWLVSGVDLAVNRGEIVTLIGPNGSGKSTTARIAIGVLKPDSGSVRRARGLRIGYVPQKLTIDWTLPLTVARLMTLTGRHAPVEVAKALEEVGIAHLAGAEVQHLSGGEFQRALLARAMIGKPDLLVLDEPVQGVDFAGEVALYKLIKQIRDRTNCGILLISHDLHVVMAETDTVVCLNGHVCCRGTPHSVAESPEYLQLFGSRAAETLAIYRHHHDHTHLSDGRVQRPDGAILGDGHLHGDHAHCDHSQVVRTDESDAPDPTLAVTGDGRASAAGTPDAR